MPIAAADVPGDVTGDDGYKRLAFFLGTGPEPGNAFRLLPYLGSAGAVSLALVCGFLIERFIGLQSVLLVFLMAILASAIAWGLLPSLFACVLSVLAFNFFLLPPIYTFAIADPENAVALFFFFIVAVIVSHLTAATRSQIAVARARAKTNAARWCWEHGAAAGRGIAGVPSARRMFLPLRTGGGLIGVIGIDREGPDLALNPDERRLLDALADQAAVAIERVSFASVLAEARVLAETERLRAALLTSISHDLRTPLASILGTVSSLRSYPHRYAPSERDELLATLQDEAERLNRFVGNLLDMTRLESGAIELRLDFFDF